MQGDWSKISTNMFIDNLVESLGLGPMMEDDSPNDSVKQVVFNTSNEDDRGEKQRKQLVYQIKSIVSKLSSEHINNINQNDFNQILELLHRVIPDS